MDTKLYIIPEDLQPQKDSNNKAHPILRVLAHIFSYAFHPVFVPLFVLALLLFVEPFLFVGASAQEKALTFGRGFINYTFFPLVSVLLLKALNLISSIKLQNRKDRIVPFIVCNIWYFWIWYVWRGLPGVPHYLIVFAFGVFTASSLGLLANAYIKISMHGIGLGTATAFLYLLTVDPNASNMTTYLAVAFLITGLVGTARLLLSEHTLNEYYLGVAVGGLAIAIANLVI